MADRIYLRPGDMPTGSLSKGKNKVDDAVSKLYSLTHWAANPLDRAYYTVNGERNQLFSNAAATLVANACAEMQNIQLQLETYLSILRSGPGELEQIDRAAKNELTNWLDRFLNSVGGAFSSNTNVNGGSYTWLFVPGRATGLSATVPTASERNKKDEQTQKQDENKQKSEKPLPEWKVPGGTIITPPTKKDIQACWVPEGYEPPQKTQEEKLDRLYNDLVIEQKSEVERGKIRYYSQGNIGWCNRASESMAFSYLGIDVHMEQMHDSEYINYEFAQGVRNGYSSTLVATDGSSATVEIEGYRENFNKDNLDRMVKNFEDDLLKGDGSYSPVMFRYCKGGSGHWILILGKNEDGTYRAIGPGSKFEEKGFNISISDDGTITGTGFSHYKDNSNAGYKAQYVTQYHRTD